MGGAFGRRILRDYAAEAIALSAKLKRPVQVAWTREDDLRHGFASGAPRPHLTVPIETAAQGR